LTITSCSTRRTSSASATSPSPARSPRSARLLRRPREEGRRFFQELVLHPQPTILLLPFLHAGTLHRGQLALFGLWIGIPPRSHPITQSAVIDTQIPSNLGGLPARFQHHLHRLSLELRAVLTRLLRHDQILSG